MGVLLWAMAAEQLAAPNFLLMAQSVWTMSTLLIDHLGIVIVAAPIIERDGDVSVSIWTKEGTHKGFQPDDISPHLYYHVYTF
jgi:hypothetical protein